MRVTEAVFRPATRAEVKAEKGSLKWRGLKGLGDNLMQICGSVLVKWQGYNVKNWTEPYPLKWIHRIQAYTGYQPARSFIEDLPTIYTTWHMITDQEAVYKAFFDQSRYGDIFQGSNSLVNLLKVLQLGFPDANITKDDFIFTAEGEHAALHHRFFVTMMNGEHFRKRAQGIIREEVKSTIDSWSKRSDFINVTEEVRTMACRIITKTLFDQEAGNKELGWAINFFNSYLVKLRFNQNTEEDKKNFVKAIDIFETEVAAILKAHPDLFKGEWKDISEARKIAYIFTAFFAGQETTAAAITHAIHKFSIHANQQQALRAKISEQEKKTQEHAERVKCIHETFSQCMKEFPPIFGIARTLKVDTVLEYKLEGEDQKRTLFFKENETIAPMMIKGANHDMKNHHFFGGGPHLCPGKQMAESEFNECLYELFSKYQVTPESYDEIPVIGQVTLQLTKDVKIKLSCLEKL